MKSMRGWLLKFRIIQIYAAVSLTHIRWSRWQSYLQWLYLRAKKRQWCIPCNQRQQAAFLAQETTNAADLPLWTDLSPPLKRKKPLYLNGNVRAIEVNLGQWHWMQSLSKCQSNIGKGMCVSVQTVMTCFFLPGFTMFLITFSEHSWLDISDVHPIQTYYCAYCRAKILTRFLNRGGQTKRKCVHWRLLPCPQRINAPHRTCLAPKSIIEVGAN